MKNSTVFFLFVPIFLSACIHTVSGNRAAALPFTRDRVESHYPRTVDQVYGAAKDVLILNGAVASAGNVYNQTNDVRFIEGKVKQDRVWIRVEAVDAGVTGVFVQARTVRGFADLNLAIELDKEIAIKLAR